MDDVWELSKKYAKKFGGSYAQIQKVKRRNKDQFVDLLIINNNSTIVDVSVKKLKRLAKDFK